MTKALVMVAACLFTACGEEPPSCQQAMNAYYGNGCAFVDLTTNQPIPKNTAVADCQSSAGNGCDAELDDWLICLEATSPAEQCDCSQEQMAFISCN